MSDKFREDWKHPDAVGRVSDKGEPWAYRRDRMSVHWEDAQTSEEYDALMRPEPKQGDMVWVQSDSDLPWRQRRFLAMVDGECWCYQIGSVREAMSWPEWRPIEPEMSVGNLDTSTKLKEGKK